MTNELSMTGLAEGLQNFLNTAPLQEGGVQYLKLSQDDPVYLYGKAKTEVSLASKFIVAASSLGHGWIAWEDRDDGKGKLIHETRCKIAQPLPDVTTLPPAIGAKNDTYEFQVGVMMAGLSGKENGITFEWWAATGGMHDFVGKLAKDILAHIAEEGYSHPNPIITLGVRSYQSKRGRRVNVPTYEIVGWSDNVKSAPGTAVEGRAAKTAIAPPADDDVEDGTEAALRARMAAEATAPKEEAPRRRRAAQID